MDLAGALDCAASQSDILVVDCLTVWTSSLLFSESCMDDIFPKWIDPVITRIDLMKSEIVFITNEVGLGIHPEYESGRKFRDLLGFVNQRFASACDHVLWFTAGIPTAIKGKLPEVLINRKENNPLSRNNNSNRETRLESVWNHLDQLTKPPRSLGQVEEIAARLCLIQDTMTPKTKPRSILVFAGDHGVCEEGVSAFPQSVTIEMMKNMAGGGAAVSVLSRLHQAELRIIDVGSVLPADQTLSGVQRSVVRAGTRNFTQAESMTLKETRKAVEIGRQCVREEKEKGTRLLILGEMGIGNTTPASALCAAILHCPVEEIAGRGTGLDNDGLKRKITVVEKALAFHQGKYNDGYELLSCLGGLEIAAMTGAILQAHEDNIPVLLDGFIVSASALAASLMNPSVSNVLIAAHASVEPGHRIILDSLHLQPILDLEMRLGEASGALIALPILDAAAAIFTEMASFETAGVSTQQL